MKNLLLSSFLISSLISFSQDVACSDLVDFVETNGYYNSSVNSYTMDSSWLFKVTLYTYDFNNYIIAEIKESEYSYSRKKYVFCGIPDLNWRNFRYGSYGDSDSYGERFWKYIKNYGCNCY